jgi:hypothetical protein
LEEKMVSKVSDEFAALMLILLDWIQMMRGALGAPKWREKQNFRGAKPCMHGYYLGKQFDLFKKIKGKLYFLF